jgi:hypothetical protein
LSFPHFATVAPVQEDRTMTRRFPRRFNVFTASSVVKHRRLFSDNRRVKYVGFRANPVSAVFEIPVYECIGAVNKEVVVVGKPYKTKESWPFKEEKRRREIETGATTSTTTTTVSSTSFGRQGMTTTTASPMKELHERLSSSPSPTLVGEKLRMSTGGQDDDHSATLALWDLAVAPAVEAVPAADDAAASLHHA